MKEASKDVNRDIPNSLGSQVRSGAIVNKYETRSELLLAVRQKMLPHPMNLWQPILFISRTRDPCLSLAPMQVLADTPLTTTVDDNDNLAEGNR